MDDIIVLHTNINISLKPSSAWLYLSDANILRIFFFEFFVVRGHTALNRTPLFVADVRFRWFWLSVTGKYAWTYAINATHVPDIGLIYFYLCVASHYAGSGIYAMWVFVVCICLLGDGRSPPRYQSERKKYLKFALGLHHSTLGSAHCPTSSAST